MPPRGMAAAIRHHHHRHLARSGKERKVIPICRSLALILVAHQSIRKQGNQDSKVLNTGKLLSFGLHTSMRNIYFEYRIVGTVVRFGISWAGSDEETERERGRLHGLSPALSLSHSILFSYLVSTTHRTAPPSPSCAIMDFQSAVLNVG